MRCPKCSKVNPENSKFCNGCGASLSEVTQKQAHTLIPEAERKRVTALFSDLSGYTAMTGSNDPELIKEVTSTIFNGIRKIIKNYDGFIERFAGDGGLALFGVPKAHENDPVRAINAAIEIHEFVKSISPRYEKKVGTSLSMHSGINTGLAITADVNPDKGTHGVTGDAINIAARLSDLASAHEIFVGEKTYKICKNNFSFESLPPAKVKGKADPISIYKVLTTQKSTVRISTGRQISSKMVGRDKDLNKLELQVAKVVNGQGSIVNIIGEAGIGKSRLFAEFQDLEILKKVTLVEGKSISIGSNLPFHPIADFLKQYAQITEDDTKNIASGKLESAIRGVEKNEADEIFPFVALLMGMNLSGRHLERVKGIEGESLEKLIFKSLRDLLISISVIKPLIIAVEDLHWADASSISLLESIFRVSQTHPILFINLFRPNFKETGDKIKHTLDKNFPDHSSTILLAPLDKKLSESLITNMLMIKGMPAQYKEKIIQRTGGNPFFMEEVVRSLIDQGAIAVKNDKFEITSKIDVVHIPVTINDLLTARIDRLEDKTKQLVKIASVVGRHFYHKILAQIVFTIEDLDQRLTYLKDIQLIREQEHVDELEYIFKHALAQEAAYNSILLKKRKQIHLQVADSIEDIFKDRIHEFYGMLATHYTKGENFEKAEFYLVKAGEEAMRSSASDEALYYYKNAMGLYIKTHGDAVDPIKMAEFEENLAFAFFNKGYHAEAIDYFNKILKRFGIKEQKKQVFLIIELIINLLNIIKCLYLPSIREKKVPNSVDNHFFKILMTRSMSLTSIDAKRFVTASIIGVKRAFKFNPSKSQLVFNIICGASAVFSWSGISFEISKKILNYAKNNLPETDDKNVIYHYKMCEMVHNCLTGNWHEYHDENLIDYDLKIGDILCASYHLTFSGLISLALGDFEHTNNTIARLKSISDEFSDDGAKIIFYFQKGFFLQKQGKYEDAMKAIMDCIILSENSGQRDRIISLLGMKCQIEIMQNYLEKAQRTIDKADTLILNSDIVGPTYYIQYLFGIFLNNLTLLEKSIIANNTMGINKYKKITKKSGKQLLKTSKKVAFAKTSAHQLMGNYYWIINKQKIALKWWAKSIKIGEKLGAKLDLSRTYFEVGKNLQSQQSKYKQLNGITAEGYLDKARTMFEEMDLQWDLNELEKVFMAN